MEVLTAFVREQAPVKTLPPDQTSVEREAKESPHERKPPSHIQAILTVIGRRTRTFENGEMERLDLNNTNLQGAHLSGAQLQQANLQRANLQRANLTGAKGVTQDQVNTACVDEHTQVPEGLTKPAPCPPNP
jgi:hypothetical protein